MSREIFDALLDEVRSVAPDAYSAARLEAHLRESGAEKSLSVSELNELGCRLLVEHFPELAHIFFDLAARDARAIGARVNRGRCEIQLGRLLDAEAGARSLLAGNSSFGPAWQLLGEVLGAQKREREAVDAFRQATRWIPGDALIHWQLGRACEIVEALEEALDAYKIAFALHPRDSHCLSTLLRLKRHLGDWDDLEILGRQLVEHVNAGRDGISPFYFLAEGAGAAMEQACAQLQASRTFSSLAPSRVPAQADRPLPAVASDKLRIGVVSCGFGPHPLTALTTRLFDLLRSERIEIHLFAVDRDGEGVERENLASAVDAFHGVHNLSTDALAEKIGSIGIEILFDIDGYSNDRTLDISARRAAPIQVAWLGYPGTTGAFYTDYFIADPFALPTWMQPCFSEKVVYLPRCYFSTDPSPLAIDPPSRESLGLPLPGWIVYVCFNASFKLNPRSFARMLRVLEAVPRSVLWLLKGPGRADERLRAAAARAAIDPSRLVFLEKLPRDIYRSAYRHADLFLDTEDYNAHTTATDALWAGCPVLTRPGESFASRVAGSFNHYLGLAEMNVDSDDAFVAVAVRYGLDSEYRQDFQARLSERNRASGLFDMPAYARDFARLLKQLSAHYRAGGAPADFPVGAHMSA